MIKIIVRFVLLVFLNLIVLNGSVTINIEQLYNDLIYLNYSTNNDLITYSLISIAVSIFTLLIINFLRPFTEIYLMHYLKFSFYFLVSLLSLSTAFISFRIYGYSRLLILVYLLSSSVALYATDKIEN